MRDNSNTRTTVITPITDFDENVLGGPLYKVPRNSLTNSKQNVDLYQVNIPENSTKGSIQTQDCNCPHCENMAKNFLYLESLIRSNSENINNCNICHSCLQYLQNVNKSIIKVFGKFDTVVQAAQAFGCDIKSTTKLNKLRGTSQVKKHKVSTHLSKPKALSHVKKHATATKVTKTGKKATGNRVSLKGLNSNFKTTSKITNKKKKSKNEASNRSEMNEVSVQKLSKPSKGKKSNI